MRVEDLVFEVRDSSLTRVGQLTPADGLTSFKATLRLNNVGSWTIDIPEGRPLADALRAPGSGIIVTNTLTNKVILSGPTVAATKTWNSGEPKANWTIRGTDDSVVLGERLAYPTPSSADVTAQTSAYDSVSAVQASTAMIGYVRRNLVSGVAPAARAISGLTTATDPSVGSFVSYAARFDMLGQVLTDIANVDGLAFDIHQVGSALQFTVWAPVDRSKDIRLDVANNTLQKSTYGYGYGLSRAIVGGQGEGTGRTFTEVSTSSSLATESSFGRRVEKFIDQRQESDSAKLIVAGKATLADSGGLITSVDVVPTSDTTMRPLVDFTLGDKVSVVVATQEVAAVITQMSVSVTDMGVYVGITVGNPVGVDFEAITAKRATDATSRISALETLDSRPAIMPVANGGTGASTLTGYVKGNGTSAMTAASTVPVGDIAGTLPVASGGTGLATLTAGSYLKGNGTTAIALQSGIPIGDISGTLPKGQGGTGVTNGTGLVQVIPSSYSTSGGTSTLWSSGRVSFDNVSAIKLNGVFTADWDNYVVVFRGSTSQWTYVSCQPVANGTVETTSNIERSLHYQSQNGGTGAFTTGTSADWPLFYNDNSAYAAFTADIYSPKFNGTYTALTVKSIGRYNGAVNYDGGGVKYSTAQFDGIYIFVVNGGVMYGQIEVYRRVNF